MAVVVGRIRKRDSWDQSRTAARLPDDAAAIQRAVELNKLVGWRKYAAFVGGAYITH
ncbi:hypothetical protein SEA_CHILIPEPPER_38 [Microbacterium phage ChiliPepper]|nr:hypothetical protein SEA_CHILIPEPPER_38 [Microbacterium phage ChiliPepper]